VDGVGEWQILESGAMVSRLIRVPGGLIYTDQNGTLFKKVTFDENAVEMSPPATHDDWVTLGQLLQENDRGFAKDDLRAMFDQFDGQEVRLSNSPIISFSRSTGGASLVLDTSDPVSQAGVESLTETSVGSGFQILTTTGNGWTVTPTGPSTPQISVSTSPVDTVNSWPVTVTISNPGAFPLNDASLEVQSRSPDGRSGSPIGNDDVDIPAGGSVTFTYPWAPGRTDTWTVRATVTRTTADSRTGDRPILLQVDETVAVAGTTLAPRTSSKLGWGATIPQRSAIALAFACLAGLIAGVALRIRIEPR
jgi:hypothetical protein